MTPELAEKVRTRLRQKSKAEGDCLLWTGGINGSGYGVMSIENRSVSVHKAAYTVFVGEIPEGSWVGHRCKSKHCVNPDHLILKASGIEERYWEKVVVVDGQCWKWTGDKGAFGYGRIQSDKKERGVLFAHRVSWEIHNGPIPDGMLVLHKCDNPECTNPDHLFLGTNADNMADKTAKGRQNRGETHPTHLLTEAEVLLIRQARMEGVRNRELAERFNVAESSICSIIKGREWKHVGGPIDKRKASSASKGEAHGMAKLTEGDVVEIRKMHAAGKTGTSIAKMFGVSISTISHIILGKSWKCIPTDAAKLGVTLGGTQGNDRGTDGETGQTGETSEAMGEDIW